MYLDKFYGAALSVCMCAAMVIARIDSRRAGTGWLDRVVQFHKNRFYEDAKTMTPIQIKASIDRAPPGYKDASTWDYDSVVRLLTLIGASETTRPVRRALRRMLQPTRRLYMTASQSYKWFPSLDKDNYYDGADDSSSGSGEAPRWFHAGDAGAALDEDAVLTIRNPVEARLPGAHLSIKLLKQILEARAMAGRSMPSTAAATIFWKPMNSTTVAPAAASSAVNSTPAAESSASNSTPAAASSAGNSTPAAASSAVNSTPAASSSVKSEGGGVPAETTTEPPPSGAPATGTEGAADGASTTPEPAARRARP